MKPKEIIKHFVEELWNKRNYPVADELFDEDFVAQPISYQEKWNGKGPDSMKDHIQEWVFGIPDLKMKINDLISENNTVIANWEIEGEHKGILYGIPATGKKVKALGMTIFSVHNEKIKELRTVFDAIGLMQQLEILPDSYSIVKSYIENTTFD